MILAHDHRAPEEKARAAFVAAFGTAAIDTLTPLSGGASSAALFRVDSGGWHWLVRVEGEPSPLRNPQQYVALRAASDAGIAPRLIHLDAPGRIAITDFVERQPLARHSGGASGLAQATGALIRRLRDLPIFPDHLDYAELVTRLFAHVRRSGLFAAGLLDRHSERLELLATKFSRDRPALVASHNDLHRDNILFDGKRLWLIDWESACRNDPLVDVAIALDNVAHSPAARDAFVVASIGHAPDPARLETVQSMVRLYYAGVLLSAVAAMPRERVEHDLWAPDVATFRLLRRERRLAPRTRETIMTAGKIYLAAFLNGGEVPALDKI